MDIQLALMCGIDIPMIELQLVIHQPTIKEISYIGEQTFFSGLQTLLVNKNMVQQGNFLLESTTDFQIFMTIMQEQYTKDKKDATISFLQLVFPTSKVLITPRSLIIDQAIIDDTNFNIFQDYLKNIFCINSSFGEQATFNPADEKAKQIAEKLMRGRQRVAEQKGEVNGSIFGRYVSILTIGLNAMPLSETIQLTMYQLYDLVERYMLHLSWDLDIRSRLAGGSPDSRPDDWMKNIH